ncbi:class I SAM-dependent methyltransferase [Candidatus Finniella inopinata]|uniref:Class I SAM-dependent methyltransferase n=1 Tax=Candidatus Finniella inopinata TaxID=1696036 RepID=A0A4V2DZM0_9PROT|nr:SAM-dependent methyltransferase [Candidatus Finniella inopinata]RZI45527.1 class I SAM-dependent methyltransferase [Candidatus Finniella inopinata]
MPERFVLSINEKAFLKDLSTRPLTVKQFIEHALYHPLNGYYMTHPVFGAAGDYTTAPEMTQIFGELLAIWHLNYFAKLPTPPSSIALIELGPGRGTLMADMLRVFQRFPKFYDLLKVYLIEISPALKNIQRQKLAGHPVEWVQTLEDTSPSDVTFIIANEFFDALPIEQYVWIDEHWQTRQVGFVDGNLDFLGPKDVPIRQSCPDYDVYMQAINQRLKTSRGAAVMIDYGDDTDVGHIHGDTLQALHQHRPTSPFENIGHQDLSHAVDFGALKRQVDPILKTHLTTQRDFLLQLGLEQRLMALCQQAPPYEAMALKTAVARLVAPSAMGTLFKVLTIQTP